MYFLHLEGRKYPWGYSVLTRNTRPLAFFALISPKMRSQPYSMVQSLNYSLPESEHKIFSTITQA